MCLYMPTWPRTSSAKTLVLGVGNTLLSDEGAGVHTVRLLQQRYGESPQVSFVDAGTLSFALAPLIEETEGLIVIDAAQLDAAPGTVRVFEDEAMDRVLTACRRLSVHELSLVDLLALVRLTGRLPARRALIGIQPQTFAIGEQPSPAVARAIPEAGALVMALIRKWSR